MRAKTHAACTARHLNLDHRCLRWEGDGPWRQVDLGGGGLGARGCAATLDRHWTRRRRAEARFDRCVVARQGWEDMPLLSVSSSGRMRPHRRVTSSVGWAAWSPQPESAPSPGQSRGSPPPAPDLGPDSIGALVVSGAAGPLATARELDDAVGARKGHGPVRLTGRRGERRLARVAPTGEGGLGDDRPHRPVSRTRS